MASSLNPLPLTEKFLDWGLTILITGVALLVFIQVLLRYVFNAPLMGIEELLMFPTTWLYLFGAVKASAEKTHIVARVLEVFIKRQKSVCLLRAIAAAASTFVLIWLMKWAYDFFKYTVRVWKESPTLYIPTFFYEGAVFISFIFILFYTICEIVYYVKLHLQTPADVLVAELSCN